MTSPTHARLIMLILVLAPLLYGVLAVLLGQDANWDLRNYHYYNGYALLHGRLGFDVLPSQTPFFYNPLLDAPFYWLTTALPAMGVTFVLGTLQGLNFVLLFFLARRVLRADAAGRDFYALGVAALALLGGGTLAELGTVFFDNIVSLGVFGTLLLALWAHDTNKKIWWFLLAGLPLGIATGAKLPTAVFCVGVCLALLCLAGAPWRVVLQRAVAVGAGVVLGIAASLGPWMFYLWQEYHNPLFPYFNNFFGSPFAPATSARDVQFVASGWEKLFFPFIWLADPKQVGEIIFRDIKIPLLYALLPLVLVWGWFKTSVQHWAAPQARVVLAACAFSYVAWLLMFSIYRYAVPLEMLAALALLLALDYVPLSLKAKRIVLVVLVVLVLVTTQAGNWGRVTHGDKFVQVTLPPLNESLKTMVLMAGTQPYSFVAVHLPPAWPVVRVHSNFNTPLADHGMNALIAARVAAHDGAFKLLAPGYDAEWLSQVILPHFGLKTNLSSCQAVGNNLNPADKFVLCDVERNNGFKR